MWSIAMCACLPAVSRAIGPADLVLPLAYSASVYSKPWRRETLAWCGWPVTGLRIASVLTSTTPGTLTWPSHDFMSALKSIFLNIGGGSLVLHHTNTLYKDA